MAMSKKDYEAIAGVFRSVADANEPEAEFTAGEMFGLISSGLANIMESDNPRFNRARFLAACTLRFDGYNYMKGCRPKEE